MIERDERRWKAADKDNDGFLSKEEFADFLHPEEAEHMRDIVVKVSSGSHYLGLINKCVVMLFECLFLVFFKNVFFLL